MADVKAVITSPENQLAQVPVWALLLAAPAAGSLARELVRDASDRTGIPHARARELYDRVFLPNYCGPAGLEDVAFDLLVCFAIASARSGALR